jgi:hypothetical protein
MRRQAPRSGSLSERTILPDRVLRVAVLLFRIRGLSGTTVTALPGAPDFVMTRSCKTGLKQPVWAARKGARSALRWGYAGRVGDRVAIEPAGGEAP